MFHSKPHRLHQAVTVRLAVAGIHIDVLTPEALRAVIGVAISLDRGTTMRAGKIFNVTLEFLVHEFLSFLAEQSECKLGLTMHCSSRQRFLMQVFWATETHGVCLLLLVTVRSRTISWFNGTAERAYYFACLKCVLGLAIRWRRVLNSNDFARIRSKEHYIHCL